MKAESAGEGPSFGNTRLSLQLRSLCKASHGFQPQFKAQGKEIQLLMEEQQDYTAEEWIRYSLESIFCYSSQRVTYLGFGLDKQVQISILKITCLAILIRQNLIIINACLTTILVNYGVVSSQSNTDFQFPECMSLFVTLALFLNTTWTISTVGM